MYPPVGTRVRSRVPQDCFDSGILPAGAVGTVVLIQPEDQIRVAVKMDDHFDWLDEWDNEFHWQTMDEEFGPFEETWEIVQ